MFRRLALILFWLALGTGMFVSNFLEFKDNQPVTHPWTFVFVALFFFFAIRAARPDNRSGKPKHQG